jgi:hypothetical protein
MGQQKSEFASHSGGDIVCGMRAEFPSWRRRPLQRLERTSRQRIAIIGMADLSSVALSLDLLPDKSTSKTGRILCSPP